MSWLLVAFTPGLLMLATLGLERLEAGLEKGVVSATDVAQFLAQAEPVDVRTLAREGLPEALNSLHRRIALTDGGDPPTHPLLVAAVASAADAPVPARSHLRHSGANKQFAPRRHVNRV